MTENTLHNSHDNELDLIYGKLGPTDRQKQFRDHKARYRLFGGAVGGGKSVALSCESLRLSLAYSGNRGFMCRHELRSFVNTTLVTLLAKIAEMEEVLGTKILSHHHKTDKVLYFINGSQILYGGLGDVSDFERIKSLEIGFFAIDEVSETVENNYQMLKSRFRWKLPDGTHPPYFGLMASNPEPGWVKNTFVIPQRLGKALPNHVFIPSLPSDNPYLPTDYTQDMRDSNPEAWVRKYVEGSWDEMEGQIWTDFRYDTHVIKGFAVPAEWKKFRTIDHGQVNPTACLWMAIDQDENIYVYREYYSPGVISSHCKAISDISTGEKYIATSLPPECWGKTMEKDTALWSVMDEYSEHSIHCTKANNEVLAGINRVGEFLKIKQDKVHPITGKQGSPSLFIFADCENLILEIPDYIWLKQTSNITGKERPRKTFDHACDALRYGIMSRPSPTVMKKVIPFNTFMETRARMIEANKRAEQRGLDPNDVYHNLTRTARINPRSQ